MTAADDRGAGVMGAIMAGGSSTRFGSPKALAEVGGRRVADRVAGVLREALGDDATIVAIVNDAALAAELGMPHRSDLIPGAGALSGVHTALVWARENGCDGIIAVSCDMPFIPATLLRELLARRADADVVIPQSDGPRGVEPMCAYYGTGCIDAIEDAIARGDARMIGFHGHVTVQRVSNDVVRACGDPSVLFMNMNTEQDRVQAERLAERER